MAYGHGGLITARRIMIMIVLVSTTELDVGKNKSRDTHIYI